LKIHFLGLAREESTDTGSGLKAAINAAGQRPFDPDVAMKKKQTKIKDD
jgi:hypothetical protein